ncbi:hypothetical protein QFZ27_001898 [Inquilinus ginsengisoli]|uniref:hypothetical protein n=1 Tax=Inquilinus ginsengisoli TaxID=363840 RepID=UPI003D1A2907
MPIRIATVRKQKTLAGLAKSLYAVGRSAERQQQAEDALLRANPHLAGDRPPPAGATLVVPEVRGLAFEEGASPQPKDVIVSGLGTADALARFARVAEKLVDLAKEAGKSDLAELKSRDFTSGLARQRPELAVQLPQIIEAAKQDAETLVRRSEQLLEALRRAVQDRKRVADRSPLG